MHTYSAVLLAGGKSTRMGRDKALLSAPGSDLLLWQRQMGVLEELKPETIFWSGHDRGKLPSHVRLVADKVLDAGPLAGISACLDLLKTDLLVVLAVDLPYMSSAFLQEMLARCSADSGAVARHHDYYEPLAAVYPKTLRDLADDHIRAGRYALQDFVRAGVARQALEEISIKEKDVPLFKNVNSPADLS